MLDAYTVRKIAPRLLFAVIGVNLSIYLCVAAIDITNVVGHGVAQLIRAPFDVGGTLDANIDVGSANLAGLALLGGGAVGGLALLQSQALSTIFALLLPILVIVLLAVLTLVIRQALLVLLTLVSPVAIVLSVLPGTDRFFRQWWDLFWRTLIIYPMIAALFAISDVLASISFNNSNVTSNTAGAVNVIGGILFTFMPIALIPFTFRMSGGVLGAFSNATGNLRSMANQFAANRYKQNWGRGYQKVASSGLFNNPKSRWAGDPEEFMDVTDDPNVANWEGNTAYDKDGNELYKTDDDGHMLDNNGHKIPVAKRDSDGRIVQDEQGRPVWEGQRQEEYGFRHRANIATGKLANVHQMKLSTSPRKTWDSLTAAADRASIRQSEALAETEEAKALAGFDDEMYVMANFNSDQYHDELIKRAGPRFDYTSGADEAENKERKKNLDNAIAMMDAYQRKGGGRATKAAAAVELHGISTSYDDQYYVIDKNTGKQTNEIWVKGKHDESQKGGVAKSSHDQMQETILRSSNKERGLGNWITAKSISAAKQAGRYDLAASASAVVMYQEAMRSGDATAIKKMQEYYDEMMVKRITPAQATQGHPRAAAGMANALEKHIRTLTGQMDAARRKGDSQRLSGLEDDYMRTLADIAGYHDSLGATGSEAVSHFDKLLSRNVMGSTLASQMERARNNEIFKRRRREYGSGAESEDGSRAGSRTPTMTTGVPGGPGAG